MKKTLMMAVAVWIGLGLCIAVPAQAEQKYVFGFSQATTTEPWRVLFNKNLRKEAEKHPEIELIVKDANDDPKKQAEDVESFITMKVSAILVTPKVADALTPAVNKAFDAGIPVFMLDRNITNDRYTQFIGGDNVLIGKAVGEFVVNHLGGAGKAKGNIVEIWGGRGTSASHDRHNGFYEVVSKEPGIRILNKPEDSDGDWKLAKAYNIMADALDKFPNIDVVYAHNDPMAHGAYTAAKDAKREKGIAFLGIDGIPEEGVRWVYEGVLAATFLYMTPGEEAVNQALKLLKGEKIPKKVTLPTMSIDKKKAEEILKEQGLIK